MPSRGMWTQEAIKDAMRVYAVTDNAWLNGRTLAECVQKALDGGVTFVQLREKEASTTELVQQARALLPLCRAAGVPFVIDDDVQAAIESGADGVHVGQEDMACAGARAMLGENAIVGVSVQTVEQAMRAQADGADYVGVGAMFATATKTDAVAVSKETLRNICKAIDIPVVIIGGVKASNVGEFAGTGFDGAAVVSGIFAADDIAAASAQLKVAVDKALRR